MSRESESEQTQRTVAELLAQYGGSSGEVAPRRRRRRAEDASDTAPQAIIERVNSDSGPMRAIRDEPEVADASPPPPPPVPKPLPAQSPLSAQNPLPQRPPRRAAESSDSERTVYAQPVQPPAPARPEPRRAAPPPKPAGNPAEQTTQVPQIVDDFMRDPSRSAIPKPEASRANLIRPPAPKPPAAKPPVMPPAPPVSMPLPKPPAAKVPVREPVTEQMPRLPSAEATIRPLDKLSPPMSPDAEVTESVPLLPPAPPKLPDPLPDQNPEDWFGDDDDELPEQENTAAHPGPYVDDDYSDSYAIDQDDEFAAEGPAGLSDADEADEEPEPERSPVKEWLVMIGQLAVGVLGGAGLWLGFNWLWRSLPAAALVVALAVTVGLVLLVRKIRRADDLQTTVLAVLVGLIVTVSPAAMLLVKS